MRRRDYSRRKSGNMCRIGRSRTCRNHLCSWDRLDPSGRRVHFGIVFLLSEPGELDLGSQANSGLESWGKPE